MMQVEVIESYESANTLQKKINKFLSDLPKKGDEVVDIKYSTARVGSGTSMNYSALIYYKKDM